VAENTETSSKNSRCAEIIVFDEIYCVGVSEINGEINAWSLKYEFINFYSNFGDEINAETLNFFLVFGIGPRIILSYPQLSGGTRSRCVARLWF
jgi:hypothetical protein